jgi:phosphoglycolate phosphatase-like HAD superfamily hydrolase
MADPSRYDAVVFDNDGVLTDLGDYGAIEAATSRVFRSFGVDPDPLVVATLDRRSRADVEEYCLSVGVAPEVFWTRREAAAARAQLEALRDGRKALYEDVTALDALDVPLAVASNSQDRTVGYVVEQFGLRDLFADYRGRAPTLTGLDRRKPDPYLLEGALDALSVPADRALYVGDSNCDVVAAHDLGMDAAFVRRPHRERYELAREPDYELGTLYDLHDIVGGRRVAAD